MRRALAFASALVLGACAASVPAAVSPSPMTSSPPSATAPASPTADGLALRPDATVTLERRWYTVPDGLVRDSVAVTAVFDVRDARPGRPRARLRSTGRTIDLFGDAGSGQRWITHVPLEGARPGPDGIETIVRVAGADVVVATTPITVSAPVYVVWTLDFEGDTAGAAEMANTAAIADGMRIPMTILWNPRVWTTTQVTAAAAAEMLAWTKGRFAKGDEVGLHIHAWTDFVRSAGVAARTTPSWAGRGDGYDVPLTAFDEEETGRLIAQARLLMRMNGLPEPTTFRAGGLFANAANLRAVAGAGFTVDTSAAPAGPFGRLQLPWTLKSDAQPYRPSRIDANATGDLGLLELPNIAGNTYGHTATSIQRVISDDLAMLPRPGEIASATRVLTLVSHPATIDATERAAIEALVRAFEPYRYDRDAGPLRFVTAAQVGQALK